MKKKNSSMITYAALGALAVAAMFFFYPYALQITGAASSGSATTQTTIGNNAPVMGPCYVSPQSVSLSSGPSTTRVWCNCTIVDTNGNSDISKVNATIFNNTVGEGASGAAGTASNLFRYNNQSCNTYNGVGNTIHANCSFDVAYYATPAENIAMGWQCVMYANDTSSGSTSNRTNFTINSGIHLVANVSTIDYGSMTPGSNSTALAFNITNFGNVIFDMKFAADNLSTAGFTNNINASNQWYSLTSSGASDFVRVPNSTAGASGVPSITTYNLNVSYAGNSASTANESNKTQYVKITVDSGQPSGSYTGTLYITGTANT